MSPARKVDTRLVVGASPRANLLPPEVLADEKFARQRSRLLLGLVLVVALVVLGYAGSSLLVTQSMDKLNRANAYTLELLTEQGKYVEVRNLSDQISIAEAALLVGTAGEVDWKQYLDLIQASLPAGTEITVVTAGLTSFVDPTATDPLVAPNIADFVFTAKTTSLPDVSQWLDNLSKIPGYAGAFPGAVTREEDGRYSVGLTLQVSEAAFVDRFAEDEEEEGAK